MFPVGSIYMSMKDVSPTSFIGGEWKKIEEKFLFGASANYPIGKDGGEASHVLTEAEMPSHNHGNASLKGSLGYVQMMGQTETSGIVTDSSEYSSLNSAYSGNTLKPRKFNFDASHTHNTNGSNKAHNNMPPYTPVYIWQRTA